MNGQIGNQKITNILELLNFDFGIWTLAFVIEH